MSSASAGIGSLPLRSSSHSVSLDGICSSRFSVFGIIGESKSDMGLVFNGGDGKPPTEVSIVGLSRRLRSSCLERGRRDCTSCVGYNRFRIDRHSSRDCDRASSVLRDGITLCLCLS